MKVGDVIEAAPNEFFRQCPGCGGVWFRTLVAFQVGSEMPTSYTAGLVCDNCELPLNIYDIA